MKEVAEGHLPGWKSVKRQGAVFDGKRVCDRCLKAPNMFLMHYDKVRAAWCCAVRPLRPPVPLTHPPQLYQQLLHASLGGVRELPPYLHLTEVEEGLLQRAKPLLRMRTLRGAGGARTSHGNSVVLEQDIGPIAKVVPACPTDVAIVLFARPEVLQRPHDFLVARRSAVVNACYGLKHGCCAWRVKGDGSLADALARHDSIEYIWGTFCPVDGKDKTRLRSVSGGPAVVDTRSRNELDEAGFTVAPLPTGEPKPGVEGYYWQPNPGYADVVVDPARADDLGDEKTSQLPQSRRNVFEETESDKGGAGPSADGNLNENENEDIGPSEMHILERDERPLVEGSTVYSLDNPSGAVSGPTLSKRSAETAEEMLKRVGQKGGTAATMPALETGSEPLSELKTPYIMSMIFPTVFLGGQGDITAPGTWHQKPSWKEWAEHLMWCRVQRAANHPMLCFWLDNVLRKQKALGQASFFIRSTLGDEHATMADIAEEHKGDEATPFVSRVLKYAKNFTGSDPYWMQVRDQAKAMVRQRWQHDVPAVDDALAEAEPKQAEPAAMSVAELRAELESLGENSDGLKADLVARLAATRPPHHPRKWRQGEKPLTVRSAVRRRRRARLPPRLASPRRPAPPRPTIPSFPQFQTGSCAEHHTVSLRYLLKRWVERTMGEADAEEFEADPHARARMTVRC